MLPTLMNLIPAKTTYPVPFKVGRSIAALLIKHPRLILAGAAVAAMGSFILLPKVAFDANPFNLSDPRSESVQTAMQLFKGEQSTPWTISILASNRQAAEKTAKRLRQLPQVKAVVTINNLVPKNQDEKLEQIEDMALVMPPVPQQPERQTAYQYRLNKTALAKLIQTLDDAINLGKILRVSIRLDSVTI